MRYFKSLTPGVKIYASGGQVIEWLTVDGATGWYSTDREPNVKALLRCIERKVGGVIQEIEKAEYDDLMGKSKGAPRFVPEREHITADGVVSPQRIAPALLSGEDPAAVGNPNIVEAEEADSISAAPTAPEVRKRGRPRKP